MDAFVAAVVRRWIGGHHRLTSAATKTGVMGNSDSFCSRARERVDGDPPSYDGGYEGISPEDKFRKPCSKVSGV